MIGQLGGRKFIFALLVVVLSSLMVIAGHLTAKEWAGFVEIIGGIYIIGNVANKIATK